jgi:hypothetical protein
MLAGGLALLAGALLLAGCGGGSSPGVANLGKHSASTTNPSSSSSAGGVASSGGGVSSAGTSSSGGQSGFTLKVAGASTAQLLRFARCMRQTGEPNFPDPSSNGTFSGNSSEGLDPSSPQFQAAQTKCAKYAPQADKRPSAAQQQQSFANLLKYSQCMRSHGEPAFPDPTRSGGRISLRVQAGPGSSLDPNSPIFQRAQQACAKLQGAPQALSSKQ